MFTLNSKILTERGYYNIGKIYSKYIPIWDGERYYTSKVGANITAAPTLLVSFSNGIDMATSLYQCVVDYMGNSIPVMHAVGLKLKKFKLPIIQYGVNYQIDAYSQGFYAGDGNKNSIYSWVYKPKYVCSKRLIGTVEPINNNNKCMVWKHGKMMPKSFVPINGTINYKLDWLAGILDADGCLVQNNTSQSLQITAIDKEFLINIMLMLNTLGIHTKVRINKKGTYKPMNDGHGGKKMYYSHQLYRLIIPNYDTNKLYQYGLRCERLPLKACDVTQNSYKYMTIESIKNYATMQVITPTKGKKVINGILFD